MIRKLFVLFFGAALLVAAAAPAGASTPSAPATTNTVCNAHKTCTSVVHTGLFVSKVLGTGVMTANGCIQAGLFVNGTLAATTPTSCFKSGTHVIATFTANRTAPDETKFAVAWRFTGHPAGPFPVYTLT